MQTSLAITALLMGLAGGPHCVAMCGPACAGLAQAAGPNAKRTVWLFQLGRMTGYGLLGGLAAASVQGLGWLTVQSAALRPAWSLFHLATLALGVALLWQARQPVWLEAAGRKAWQAVRSRVTGRSRHVPLVLGLAWALLPCSLLYSALMLAALSGQVGDGIGLMVLFALGTSLTLSAAPWLWLHLQGRPKAGEWGVRLAGLALSASAAWALWLGLVHDQAPWCQVP